MTSLHTWDCGIELRVGNLSLCLAATLGLTRCEIEQQKLVRWRRELVVVLQSAKLPVCGQNRLATHPDAAIAELSVIFMLLLRTHGLRTLGFCWIILAPFPLPF